MEDKLVVKYYNAPLSVFGFLSHLPLLTAACTISTGSVLELGAGFGSTFMLHGICASAKRKIVTIENDKNWIAAFNFYKRPWHEFKLVSSFVGLPEYSQNWGLAFVDHGILGERGIALASVHHVPIVVCHDTCHEDLNYFYDNIYPLRTFKYRFDFHWQGPMTSVLSDTVNVNEIFKEMGL